MPFNRKWKDQASPSRPYLIKHLFLGQCFNEQPIYYKCSRYTDMHKARASHLVQNKLTKTVYQSLHTILCIFKNTVAANCVATFNRTDSLCAGTKTNCCALWVFGLWLFYTLRTCHSGNEAVVIIVERFKNVLCPPCVCFAMWLYEKKNNCFYMCCLSCTNEWFWHVAA